MDSVPRSPAAAKVDSPLRWRIAFLVSVAIAISYLDRQTLPWAIKAIQADIPFSNQIKAGLDSAFLATYGLMYLAGGLLLDRVGTRRGFLLIMIFWSLRTSLSQVSRKSAQVITQSTSMTRWTTWFRYNKPSRMA